LPIASMIFVAGFLPIASMIFAEFFGNFSNKFFVY
jgi:hypothetical protein